MAGEKIMVVVLLLIVIFLGIGVFMFYIEKRLSSSEKKVQKLEDAINQKNKPKNV